MIVGYQAFGTLGRKLVDGHPQVKIHGDEYPVRARIHTVGGLSAHGDVDDLLRWLRNFNSDPAVHVVHGEAETKTIFRDTVQQQLGLRADVPAMGDVLEL
jgi:metallo-beta-lactamase family protein